MTWAKLFVVMSVLSVGSAALVGFVSRTPASVRNDAPPVEARDPALGATFTDDQIERHAAYRRPGYLSFALGAIIPIVLLVLLSRGPLAAFVDRTSSWRGGWAAQALAAAVLVALLTTLFSLPLSYVRGHAMGQAWGLSTQDVGGWLNDQVRGLLVTLVIAAVSALAFFGVVRLAPKTWWLWGWAAFTALTALLVFLYPVAIAPLFNRFTSMEQGPLRERILALGDDAGVRLDDVLVADASKRTTAENAYVAGLGSTKQMVLFDTLLTNADDDEVAFVVAHELGHKIENHVVKNVLLSSVALFVGFGVLYLMTRNGNWLGPGVDSVRNVKALPALLLFLSVATLLTLPLQNTVSRAFERRADEIAMELTEDPAPAVRAFRRLAFANLADLRPPGPAVWALFTHPPIPDRIETFLSD